MFQLTEAELQNAFEAISHHGNSAMLPPPHEWRSVVDKWPDIKAYLAQQDLDIYEPYKPLRVFAPKTRANIRVLHLLHPEDLLIYTALVLIVKNDIENERIPRQSRRVYSYRVDVSAPNRLYNTRGAYDAYLAQLKKKAAKPTTKFVGIADIADFYPRIYQHRLENVIQAAASTPRRTDVARVLVKKFIANLMDRNSYGIPVGPYASRILGEAILIDVDATLQSRGIDYVRWVDDYNIFSRSEFLAQSALFDLAEWLFVNHGLTLQAAKTKLLTVSRYKSEILSKPEEKLTDRDHVISLLKETGGMEEYEDEAEDDALDQEQIEATLQQLHGYDLHGMLSRSVSDQALVDYEVVRYVLTRLPRIPNVDEDLKQDVLNLVIENAELLYPAAEYIATYILSFEFSRRAKRKIAKKLLKPLRSKRTRPPDYYIMWVLYIFSTSEEWNQMADIIDIYRSTTSEVVKRYAALAVAVGGTRSEALIVKDDLPSASDLLRLAILSASNKLGQDERRHWKRAHPIEGIVEKFL
jgi:Reverse transcriptase (RNA-dependent DNA polymerase)